MSSQLQELVNYALMIIAIGIAGVLAVAIVSTVKKKSREIETEI